MIQPQKFRKQPVEIEAVQFDGENGILIQNWAAAEKIAIDSDWNPEPKPVLVIATLEGAMIGRIGDWIIKGIKGEFYPIKNEIFLESYEAVE